MEFVPIMQFVPIMILFALAFTVYCVVCHLREKKKLQYRLQHQFGTVPDSCFKSTTVRLFWEELQAHLPHLPVIDDTTWNDLSMEAVYDRIENCESSIGQEYLYATLHMAQPDEHTLVQREKLIGVFEDAPLRLATQVTLAKLGKRIGQRLATLLFKAETFELQHPRIYVISAFLPLALLCIVPFFPQLGGILVLAAGAHNITLYMKAKKALDQNLETVCYFMSALFAGKRLARELKNACPGYCAKLEEALAPLHKLNFGSLALSASSQTDFETLTQVFGMLTLLPIIEYGKAVKTIRQNSAQVRNLYLLLGELDLSICILSYRASLSVYTTPQVGSSPALEFDDITHPLLAESVPNSAAINQNWLLTGSNASGKSTFIKAVALNIILAETIYTCTARRMVLQFLPVVTSMAVADDVTGGESYFVAEIKSMRRIVRGAESNAPFYFFIDEILKGTNTIERVAASTAVLRYIDTHAPCVCLAATHDFELTELLTPQFRNMHFSESVSQDGVCFDYQLKSGASNTRNAIRLLDFYNYPPEVVAAAQRLADSAARC